MRWGGREEHYQKFCSCAYKSLSYCSLRSEGTEWDTTTFLHVCYEKSVERVIGFPGLSWLKRKHDQTCSLWPWMPPSYNLVVWVVSHLKCLWQTLRWGFISWTSLSTPLLAVLSEAKECNTTASYWALDVFVVCCFLTCFECWTWRAEKELFCFSLFLFFFFINLIRKKKISLSSSKLLLFRKR